MTEYASATVDDMTVTSNSGTVEEIQAAIAPAGAVAEPETLATDDGLTDDEAPAPDPASEAGKTLAKKKNSYQSRIGELTRQARDAERKAAGFEAQLRERAAPAPDPAPRPVEAPSGKPSVDAIGSTYATYEDYTEALADWKVEQKFAAREQAERQTTADRQQRDAFTKAQERIDAFKATTPDFEPTVIGGLIPAGAPSGQAVLEHLFFSEVGPALAHHLASDPAELERITSLPYGFAIAALGRLEGTLDTRTVAAPTGPALTAPTYTPAKPPIKPVGSSPVASDVDAITDDLSVDEHIRRMNAKDRATRRRP